MDDTATVVKLAEWEPVAEHPDHLHQAVLWAVAGLIRECETAGLPAVGALTVAPVRTKAKMLDGDVPPLLAYRLSLDVDMGLVRQREAWRRCLFDPTVRARLDRDNRRRRPLWLRPQPRRSRQ